MSPESFVPERRPKSCLNLEEILIDSKIEYKIGTLLQILGSII